MTEKKLSERLGSLLTQLRDDGVLSVTDIRESLEIQLQLVTLQDKVEAMRQLQIEVENVIGMAHSFANFPSWLEQLEKTLAVVQKEK